jgi:hypothetical protein
LLDNDNGPGDGLRGEDTGFGLKEQGELNLFLGFGGGCCFGRFCLGGVMSSDALPGLICSIFWSELFLWLYQVVRLAAVRLISTTPEPNGPTCPLTAP